MQVIDTDSYSTPETIIEAARRFLGAIETDPASNEYAQGYIQATTYYTAERNGLIQPWFGTGWLNPPYSRGLVTAFIKRLVSLHSSVPLDDWLCLVNSSTEVAWYKMLAGRYPLAHGRSRVQFNHPDPLAPRDRNRYAQTLFYLPRVDRPDKRARIIAFYRAFDPWFYPPVGTLKALQTNEVENA